MTYEVRDVYLLQESRAETAHLTDKAVDLKLTFDPDYRFISAGLIVPAIPVNAHAKKATALTLRMEVALSGGGPFSFGTTPCVVHEATRICPQRITFHNLRLPKQDRSALFEVAVTDNTPYVVLGQRVTSERIFRLNQHPSDMPWQQLSLWITATYDCGAPCPPAFRLDLQDFVMLGEQTPALGAVDFVRERQKEYAAQRQVM